MRSAELQRLLEKYFDETITEEEFKELWSTLKNKEHDTDWFKAIEVSLSDTGLHGLSDKLRAEAVLAEIKDTKRVEHLPYRQPIRSTTIQLMKYAAAVLLIVSIGWLWLSPKPVKEKPTATVVNQLPAPVTPGGDRALLTLADGTKIVLDNAANGNIARQGAVQVVKLSNGQLQYQPLTKGAAIALTLQYNTMSTPRGGQYKLMLPDGTAVWLNAESSITYPVVFAADQRSVQVSGEAYFEVAKDKERPFRVKAGDANIEVLGTHFNVNAYANEGETKTSLLEGSVKINSQILKPGQAFANGRIFQTDVSRDVAWKNGVFDFNDQNLAQVMRQLARWYNLDVEYPIGIPHKEYGGEMGRNLNLEQVLKGLEDSGVRFELNGRKLIVRP